ncbi:MAG TPA: FAD:protein FMN transferase [Tepidisphaeraceae bacterium]|nr:FAD:protein FMN transferase [Tepidisphaeraceae bacterium]
MLQTPPNVSCSIHARIRETVRAEVHDDVHQLTFRAMSTPARICFRQDNPAVAADFQREVVEWVANFESRYSRFIPQSIIGQINAAAGDGVWHDIDEQDRELFDLCDQMHSFTRGVFDPAALPLLRLWDWKANPPRVPDSQAIDAARAVSGWDKVRRCRGQIQLPLRGMGIDLGGIGKEYAVDCVLNMARQRGMSNVLVDIGQDVRVCGKAPGKDAWYIGLEEPDQPGNCWTCLRLSDHAVATSGDYLRCFTQGERRFGHILDPRTGEPVNNRCQAATVIAPTCLLAGIFSTVAFILGPIEGLKLIQHYHGAEACITTADARHQTRRFSYYVPA